MGMKRKARRLFSFLLCVMLVVALTPAATMTVHAAQGSDFIVTGGIRDVDYTYGADGVLTFTNPGIYIISMASSGAITTTDRIVVNGGTTADPVEITLDGVGISNAGCAFELQGNSVVRLTLAAGTAISPTSGEIFILQWPAFREPKETTRRGSAPAR